MILWLLFHWKKNTMNRFWDYQSDFKSCTQLSLKVTCVLIKFNFSLLITMRGWKLISEFFSWYLWNQLILCAREMSRIDFFQNFFLTHFFFFLDVNLICSNTFRQANILTKAKSVLVHPSSNVIWSQKAKNYPGLSLTHIPK